MAYMIAIALGVAIGTVIGFLIGDAEDFDESEEDENDRAET